VKIISSEIPEHIISSIRKSDFNIIPGTGNLLADPNVLSANVLIASIDVIAEDFFQIVKMQNPEMLVVAITSRGSSEDVKTQVKMKGTDFFLRDDADSYEISSFLSLLKMAFSSEKYESKLPVKKDGLINMLACPVFIKDLQNRFIDCNDAFEEHIGIDIANIIGKKTGDFMSGKRAYIYEEIDRKVLETEKPMRHEGRAIFSEGEGVNIIVVKSPYYDVDNKLAGIIGVIVDISRRKEKEKELRAAKQKAEKADKLKTSFLSNMSHEIRTPMNAIVGFSQLLSIDGLADAKKKLYIDQVNSNAQQLLKLIEDIIEVSKIEAGGVKIVKSTCYVNQLLDDLKLSFETHKARQGKQHIELITQKKSQEQDFSIQTDPYRLNQIITNLLGNAVKFTDDGSITFGYDFYLKGGNEYLKFFVKDTGLGINKEKVGLIFDRFLKVPAGKTKLYGGTGLGLSISKSLSEILGGEIWLESVENEGTTFFFTIPAEIVEIKEEVVKVTEKKDVAENLFFWPDKKIMITDDEEMNFLFLQEVLRETQAELVWCKNGKDASDKVVGGEYFDLILMDIRMPVMDGLEATKRIKSHTSEIPIIIQSAYAMEIDKKKGFDAGCDGYAEKPIKADSLLAEIKRLLGENK